jgi:hypothetical protein
LAQLRIDCELYTVKAARQPMTYFRISTQMELRVVILTDVIAADFSTLIAADKYGKFSNQNFYIGVVRTSTGDDNTSCLLNPWLLATSEGVG